MYAALNSNQQQSATNLETKHTDTNNIRIIRLFNHLILKRNAITALISKMSFCVPIARCSGRNAKTTQYNLRGSNEAKDSVIYKFKHELGCNMTLNFLRLALTHER